MVPSLVLSNGSLVALIIPIVIGVVLAALSGVWMGRIESRVAAAAPATEPGWRKEPVLTPRAA